MERIEVRGAEQLAAWCNVRPTVGRWLLQRPGIISVERWAADSLHGVPYQATESRKGQLASLIEALDPNATGPCHLHLRGNPGVGKTRLALEACRVAAWRDAVAYFTEPGPEVKLLIEQLGSEISAKAVVVVDECRAEHVRTLGALARLAGGRVRLLTIGSDPSEPLEELRSVEVGGYSTDEIEAILQLWYPGMPRERREFAARLSDGYVGYARIIGEALEASPTTAVADLLGAPGLTLLLDRLLEGLNRRHLYVAAAMRSVGWNGELEDEGRAVAQHLGLEWAEVKTTLVQAKKKGILRTSERLCYVSPLPLAISLALEAWAVHAGQLRTLPDALRRESAIRAFHERLEQLGGSPYAAGFFRAELERFQALADFSAERGARLWAALAAGEPVAAVAALRRALEGASQEERGAFAGAARREVMWALPRLAWEESTFDDAMLALAHLASAETETWANNATREFASHFQIYLGGTTVPYLDRLRVLDHLAAQGSQYLPLIVASLATAAEVHETRFGGGEHHPAKAVGPEWRPTPKEADEARRTAFARLRQLLPVLPPELEDAVFGAIRGFVWPLSRFGYGEELRGLIADAVAHFSGLRERLRREIAELIALGDRAGPRPDTPPLLQTIHDQLVDRSLRGRLLQHVGPQQWGRPADPQGFSELVRELAAAPQLVVEHYGWLTSGEANAAFELGWALGRGDEDLQLMPEIVRPDRGPDGRLLAGFVLGVSSLKGDAWLDDWLAAEREEGVGDGGLAVEILSQSAPNGRRVRMLLDLLRAGRVNPDSLRAFAYGRWVEVAPAEQFRSLLDAALGLLGGEKVALVMLANRLRARPDDIEVLRSQALSIVSDATVVQGHGHEGWLWCQVAKPLVDSATPQIVRALCEVQLADDVFLEHQPSAEEILLLCAERQPAEAWAVVAEYLGGPRSSRFVIGFPKAFVSRVPRDTVLRWVAADPARRAVAVAHITSPIFASDEALESVLIERYGEDETVSSALYGGLVSGVWMGPISPHWQGRAEEMETLAARTRLPSLRNWARGAAQAFREMRRYHAAAEDDEAIRWR